MISRRILLAALLAVPSWVAVSHSCEFCQAEKGPTLADDYSQAALVLLVHTEKPSVYEGNNNYTTEVIIDQVIKDHDIIKGKKSITIPKRADAGLQFIVFCDVYKEKINAHRGVVVEPKSDLLKYFEGARAMIGKPISERLRYSFDYLTNPDQDVARDAYKEYAFANYSDYKEMAKTLPADKLASWITDPKTPPFRLGLYASLLGHCGKEEHAKLLRQKMNEAIENKNSQLYGLLWGYTIIAPKDSLAFMKGVLGREKEEFFVRNICFKVAVYVREQRSDLIPSSDLNAAVAQALAFPVTTDIAVDYLRESKAWELTDKIVELYGKKTADKNYDIDAIKRAILRFGLVSPEPRAAAFIKEMRARNPQYVADTEELLKIEQETIR